MRTLKIFTLLFVVCLLFALLVGCGETAETTDPEATEPVDTTVEITEPAETTVAVTEPPVPQLNVYYPVADVRQNIKLIGRSQFVRGTVASDWSASGIEFEYEGYGILEITVERGGEGTSNVALVAEVDGKSTTLTVSETGVASFRLASELPQGVHHVLIRRRTMVEKDAKGMTLQFKGIQLTGFFCEKPANKTYKVAFVGDSITCGVGISGSNGLATYAVDFCTRENLDYDICSISGIGVYHSTKKHGGTAHSMTEYYPYYNYYRSDTLRYLPERKADLVIVNLNTNDSNTGSSSDETAYKAALKTLISEIRAAHGENVNILWVVGMMVSPSVQVNQWLNSVFTELGGESAGLYKITVDTDTSGESGHPSLASHQAVSQALSAYIRSKGLLDLPAQSN